MVCTHTHADHYGLAGPIVDAAGCELWMHPAWGHVRRMVEDPEAALERQIALARGAGVPEELVEELRAARRGTGSGVARIVEPDRELTTGDEVETDHGTWRVHETPGHAPSHIVLHQPDSGLLISGDHLRRQGLSVLRLRAHARPGRRVQGVASTSSRRWTRACACRATGARIGTSRAR